MCFANLQSFCRAMSWSETHVDFRQCTVYYVKRMMTSKDCLVGLVLGKLKILACREEEASRAAQESTLNALYARLWSAGNVGPVKDIKTKARSDLICKSRNLHSNFWSAL